jgi:hypothetical protein
VNKPLQLVLEPPVEPYELDDEADSDFCSSCKNCCRMSLMELVPGEPAAAAVLGQPVDDDAAVCGNQRHAPRHVGRARPCHAAVLFANAAESFSPNGAASPLPKRGPQEIRSVAKALNRMRERNRIDG